MTWLQALVALALFAPGAVAPSAHLDIRGLSMFSTAVFAIGVLTSFWTGGLINQIGSLRMATLCAVAVAASMALAALGSDPALLVAGLCLGLAFGPETPAGLLATPILISAIKSFAGLSGAFVSLAILAFCGTAALIWRGLR
jgi:hypothetical protein